MSNYKPVYDKSSTCKVCGGMIYTEYVTDMNGSAIRATQVFHGAYPPCEDRMIVDRWCSGCGIRYVP